MDKSQCILPPAPKLIFTPREEIWVGDNPGLGFLQYPSRGDVLCQRLADAVPALAGKTFHALLCGREPDVANNAYLGLRDRTTDSPGGYVRTDGVHVANNLDDLLDGSIENPISMDQDGQLLPDIAVHNVLPVWTGCRADGSSYDYSLQCSDVGIASWWFRSGIVNAEVGDPSQSDGRWLNSAISTCGPPRHLYCIEQ